MILVGTISFVLLLVCVYLIARPFLVPQLVLASGDTEQLEEERARLRGILHDLEMEFSTGKLAEVEYTAQRERREAELATVEEALDVATIDEADPFGDDELEALIAARRDALAGSACPACAAPTDPDDRFCRACGADLTEVIAR
jgi:uncharacterized protein YlxP (DUF503 family)